MKLFYQCEMKLFLTGDETSYLSMTNYFERSNFFKMLDETSFFQADENFQMKMKVLKQDETFYQEDKTYSK